MHSVNLKNGKMKTRYILSSLFATALLAGCSNEEILENGDAGLSIKDRPEVNVTFGVDEKSTRMEDDGANGAQFDLTDKVGSVLLDYDRTNPTTYWNITDDQHIGNNKFDFNPTSGKFETAGTMVKGSWLFYLQYNKQMTTERTGVKFKLPVVQKYATDHSEIAKNEFRISPIVNLGGQETGFFNFNLPLRSVYAYANMVMKFPEAVTVQKIVVKPTTNNLSTYAPFAANYKIVNTAVPVAKFNTLPDPYETEQSLLDKAESALVNGGTYDYATIDAAFKQVLAKDGAEDAQLMALNCLDNTTSSQDFTSRISIPAGKYANITLYAYTDKGIYKYDVKNDFVAAETPTAQSDFYLRRQHNVNLHKINPANIEAGKAYLEMTETVSNEDLKASTETDGTVVISQEDLIAVINGINTNDAVNIRVLGDDVKITPAVMAALTAKRAVKDNVSLVFSAGTSVVVEGSTDVTAPMGLHHINFLGGCDVTTGYVKVGADINIPTSTKVTVNSGANVSFAVAANTNTSFAYTELANAGVVTIDAATITIGSIVNTGNITINSTLENVATVTNNGNVTVKGTLNVKGLSNDAATLNLAKGVITNDGKIRIKSVSASAGDITNNASIDLSAAFDNSGTVTNTAKASFISGDATITGSVGTLNNTGTINNDGVMYCLNGDHTINNTGEIFANTAKSKTYITTNSSASELKIASTDVVVRGEVYCEERDADMTVAKKDFQGYISWKVTEAVTLAHISGDKFNKVYLNGGDCTLSHTNQTVKYVVINAADAKITLKDNYAELTANVNATLKADQKSIAKLTIAVGKILTVPTENILGAYDYTMGTVIKEFTAIHNNGTLLVGGKFFSTISTFPGTGIFASGSGVADEAYFWGTTTNFVPKVVVP